MEVIEKIAISLFLLFSSATFYVDNIGIGEYIIILIMLMIWSDMGDMGRHIVEAIKGDNNG